MSTPIFFNISGIISYQTVGGIGEDQFVGITEPEINSISNYFFLFVKRSDYDIISLCLDPSCDLNGITIGNKKYFGKDLYNLSIELRRIETEEILESL